LLTNFGLKFENYLNVVNRPLILSWIEKSWWWDRSMVEP